MNYFKALFCLILLICVGVAGCSQKEQMTSISSVDTKEVKKHSGTYVGDNSNVIAIVQALPGGDTFKEINLENKTVKVTYGDVGGDLSKDEILKYWFDGQDTLKKNFFYNAIYLTLLVPNAESYNFNVDNQSFSVSREEMEEFISKHINSLPNNNELFQKEKAQQYIDDNKEKINDTVKSKELRKQFFKDFPIIEK
ncbi:DUF4825 domain-containing protein [Priestia megaterium]|jgi:hypothetical protein|uniref:DUF4825 domain-containing protein n=1 Tax=Priestia megaterium TaxID=1404 RepID=UPI0021AC4FA9|nr:DUF4825 domain-containing protein [Priestia megaterium]MCR8924518.1 DUF4825 domain-containing protein [Priestia megaterium]MDC7783405.1 DUF4825 domain-containing protein [Priestia megaterium]